MKIALAQIQSNAGEIAVNTKHHIRFIELANAVGVELLVFPELSLTGYEPSLAKESAITIDSPIFDPIQLAARKGNMMVGVGMPILVETGIAIGMVLMGPDERRTWYAKQFLHPDEESFFKGVYQQPRLPPSFNSIGLAICYELSVTTHAEQVHQSGKTIYLASVAKSANGVAQAGPRLARISQYYGMIAGMVNSIGPSDDFIGAGESAWWDPEGNQIGSMNNTAEGILLLNTNTMVVDAYLI